MTERHPAPNALTELRDEVRALRARVDALEGREPDEDDAALLVVLVQHVRQPFTAADLDALRRLDEDAARLLDDLAIDGPAAAGCWLRRLKDRVIGGLRLRRGHRGRAGYLWRVTAV